MSAPSQRVLCIICRHRIPEARRQRFPTAIACAAGGVTGATVDAGAGVPGGNVPAGTDLGRGVGGGATTVVDIRVDDPPV